MMAVSRQILVLFPTKSCFPQNRVPPTPAMLWMSYISATSCRDFTPTSFFRVMNRLSKGFMVYMLYLKTNLVHRKMLLCILMPYGSPQRDSARFWRPSNHLDINSIWKSLVAICVCACVWMKFEHAFSMCLSPAQNTFVASDKYVRLQCDNRNRIRRWVAETISSLAINVFVCSVILRWTSCIWRKLA